MVTTGIRELHKDTTCVSCLKNELVFPPDQRAPAVLGSLSCAASREAAIVREFTYAFAAVSPHLTETGYSHPSRVSTRQ